MKLLAFRLPVSVLLFFLALPLMDDSVSAHRVNVFAWAENDMVFVSGKFAGGKKVRGGKIVVLDPEGTELLSGLTDNDGEFSFEIPKRTDLRIVLIAGQGHQGEWTIQAAELADLPTKEASNKSTEQAVQFEQQVVSKKSGSVGSAGPPVAIEPENLEAVIETVLDRKLKPITRMLADMRQKGPTVKDIFAGIGYILGLVGIAAYVQSRKKKA